MKLLETLNKNKIAIMKENKVNKQESNTYKINIINDVLTEAKSYAVSQKIADVKDLTDEQVLSAVKKVAKGIDKEIEGLKSANRDTKKAEIQKEYILTYLPKKKDELETEDYVKVLVEKGLKLPEIMREAKNNQDLDMAIVSKIAKKLLG